MGTIGSRLGAQIATGRTSRVYALGDDSVVKILNPELPDFWTELEANAADAVAKLGLPAPEFRGLVELDGRSGLVFERIRGRSMWEHILDDPAMLEHAIAALGAAQRQIHQASIPAGLPGLVQRLRAKIAGASRLSEAERDEGCVIAGQLPSGAALLHGDLHPGNVLLVDDEPVVIDWFDASIGHPMADIVRSLMLLRTGLVEVDVPHLPGATPDLLDRLHQAYADEFESELRVAADERLSWEAVVAAGRMSERAQHDESGLIAAWSARPQMV